MPNDEIVQSGLHYIRGFSSSGAVPHLGNAYLTTGSCGTGFGSGYFHSFPNVCGAGLNATIEAGSCFRLPNGPNNWQGPCVDPIAEPTATETRIAANVEVKYTLVYGTGNGDDICDFGGTCDLSRSGMNTITATGALDMAPSPNQTRYAVALRVRMKDTVVPEDLHPRHQLRGSMRVVHRRHPDRPHRAEQRHDLRQPGSAHLPREQRDRRLDSLASDESRPKRLREPTGRRGRLPRPGGQRSDRHELLRRRNGPEGRPGDRRRRRRCPVQRRHRLEPARLSSTARRLARRTSSGSS